MWCVIQYFKVLASITNWQPCSTVSTENNVLRFRAYLYGRTASPAAARAAVLKFSTDRVASWPTAGRRTGNSYCTAQHRADPTRHEYYESLRRSTGSRGGRRHATPPRGGPGQWTCSHAADGCINQTAVLMLSVVAPSVCMCMRACVRVCVPGRVSVC